MEDANAIVLTEKLFATRWMPVVKVAAPLVVGCGLALVPAPRGLMVGLFFSIFGVIVLNSFLNLGMVGILIAVAIGVFGVLTLVYATSDVLNSPELDSPIAGR